MDHLLLRPWTASDEPELLEIFRASVDLDTQYPLPVTTIDAASECRERMLGFTDAAANFAIEAAGRVIGNVGISHIERRHDTGWVSYFSSGAVRGRGYVSRATAAAATWALTELQLFRLELGQRTNNPASEKVASAAGFVPEGIERAKLRYGDERFDVRTWARLATDPAPPIDPNITLYVNHRPGGAR